MTSTHLAPSPVHEFADQAWEQYLELNPLWATLQGDDRWDDRLDDPSPAGRARELALVDRWEAECAQLAAEARGVEDQVTLHLIGTVARLRREAQAHRVWHLEAIDQYAGPQALPGDLARMMPLDSAERVDRLLARLASYPAWMRSHLANLAEGVAAGRTAARPVVERCVTQLRRICATPASDTPLLRANPGIGEVERARLQDAIERHVLPAQVELLAALETYLPRARTGEGVCWLPDGEDLYRYAILAWTTLDEDPRAIHEYGLDRLAQIEAAADAIARELGHADAAVLRAFLDGDPRNHVSEGAELVRLAEEQIARTEAVAPLWFGRLPAAACQVRPVEPHMEQEAPPAFYMQPSADGSRPGIYFINTYAPASRHLHRLATTTFHEAVPGHHFQVALELTQTELPAFRRFGSRLAGGAYVEGWGLYAERLADEMGLFADPRERFGMLESEAWRACRLIVDTGLHAFGWTRQQSIDLLRARAGLSALEAETETDRYISWPGQALSYMLGQRELLELRRALQERDGLRFSLRAFHDEVLAHGALPLVTLRRHLPGWVRPLEA